MDGALDAPGVIDTTQILTDPFGARQLAVPGAEVIKVADPRPPAHCARTGGCGRRQGHVDGQDRGPRPPVRSLLRHLP